MTMIAEGGGGSQKMTILTRGVGPHIFLTNGVWKGSSLFDIIDKFDLLDILDILT